MSKKIALPLALSSALLSSGLFAATTENQPEKQGYFNPQDSGVVLSISGGIIQSQASIDGTNAITGDFSKTLPTQSGGTGDIDLGYRFAFGQKDKWNQFYFGGAATFSILGNMMTNAIGFSEDKVTTDQGSVLQYGLKIFIGKYWKSPFYTSLSIGSGGSSSAGFFMEGSVRAGYDITENLSIYGQIKSGGQFDFASSVASIVVLSPSSSGERYTSEQIGLQYKF